MNYFIADLHFGHKNALTFDNRPFVNTEEMDNTIITRWNNTVNINDDVYILGDISWYNSIQTIKIFKQLNGNKHLIIGNHDKKLLKNPNVRSLFMEITDYKELNLDDNTNLILSHYPIPCFKNHFYKWIHLYGHVHISFEWDMMERCKKEMIEQHHVPCRMYNVGAMMTYINYTPRTLNEILQSVEPEINKERSDYD